MMCSFLIPFILRPIDCIANFLKYFVGLMTYLFMMPTFTNIMQIYAMCNLHDISWGNRPATTQGVEAVTFNKDQQEKLRIEYQVYRSNFLYIWMMANVLFAVITTMIVVQGNVQIVNDGHVYFLQGFSLFIASLVLFKFFFALIYLIFWQVRICRKKEFQKYHIDEEEEWEKVKKDRNAYESSSENDDEEGMYEEEEDLSHKKKGVYYDPSEETSAVERKQDPPPSASRENGVPKQIHVLKVGSDRESTLAREARESIMKNGHKPNLKNPTEKGTSKSVRFLDSSSIADHHQEANKTSSEIAKQREQSPIEEEKSNENSEREKRNTKMTAVAAKFDTKKDQ